jgi:glutaredoxin
MDPRKMPKIVLYSRQGCHLCDDAALLLKRHRLTFETVDIDADEGLRARYNECVPVVVVDGKERFRGRIDEILLLRLLRARQA